VIVVVPVLFILGALTQRLLIQPLMASGDDPHRPDLDRHPQAVRRRVGDVGAEDEEREVDERRRQARVLLGQAVILAAAVVLVVGLHLFLSRTQTGRAIRRRRGARG
jgi:branched-chain amino acid transport system permease protein